MATVSRGLPERPHLDVPKREARELLEDWRAGQPEALDRIRRRHPKFREADHAAIAAGTFRLNDAQLVIAREYGFSSWPELKQRINCEHSRAGFGSDAIHDDDREAARAVLAREPNLLHIPLWSGNWGPPMSHAANLGRLEIIKAMAALGARDFQHAFDRALLQGQLECARWLHEHGAKLAPGLVMGACETLNASGFVSSRIWERRSPISTATGSRRSRWRSRRMGGIRGQARGARDSSRGTVTNCRTRRSWRFIAATSRGSKDICAVIRSLIERRFSCARFIRRNSVARDGRSGHALDADRRNDAAAPGDRFR